MTSEINRLKACLAVDVSEALRTDAETVIDREAEELRVRIMDDGDVWILRDLIKTDPALAWRLGIRMLRVAQTQQALWAAGTMVFEDLLADNPSAVVDLAAAAMQDLRFRVALYAVACSRLAPATVSALVRACEDKGQVS